MYVYIDESIHERGDFIVIAAVFSEHDLQPKVEAALRACGFDPAHDEFKSSMTMRDNPAAQDLREGLQDILSRCKLALAVCPLEERAQIMAHAGALLADVIHVTGAAEITVFFDGGMKRTPIDLPASATLVTDCDSKRVAGIQVADCAAHLASTVLLSEMGVLARTVPAKRVYPEEEGEIELAWTLMLSIRYAVSSGRPVDGYDADGMCELDMHAFGLRVADTCSEDVKAAAQKRLGSIWLGCVH